MLNISKIVDKELCNGCCECIAACAANNICIVYDVSAGHPVPFVSSDECKSCGECLKVCKKAALC